MAMAPDATAAAPAPERKRRRFGPPVSAPTASTTTTVTPAVSTELMALAPGLFNKPTVLAAAAPIIDAASLARRFSVEIDINDSPKKGLLTQKTVLEDIAVKSKATVFVRGRFRPPGDSSATDTSLHLHIEGSAQQDVDTAASIIRKLLSPVAVTAAGEQVARPPASGLFTSGPQSTHCSRGSSTPLGSPPCSGNAPPLTAQIPLASQPPIASAAVAALPPLEILVGLDSVPGYQVRGKLLGPKGSYLKHIHETTGVRVQLIGSGSGNKMPDATEDTRPLTVQFCTVD